MAELDSMGNAVTKFTAGYFIKNDTTYRVITDHPGTVRQRVNTGVTQ